MRLLVKHLLSVFLLADYIKDLPLWHYSQYNSCYSSDNESVVSDDESDEVFSGTTDSHTYNMFTCEKCQHLSSTQAKSQNGG